MQKEKEKNNRWKKLEGEREETRHRVPTYTHSLRNMTETEINTH